MSEIFKGASKIEEREKKRREDEEEKREVIRQAGKNQGFVSSGEAWLTLTSHLSDSQRTEAREKFERIQEFDKDTIEGLIASAVDEVNRRVYGLIPEFMDPRDRLEIQEIIKEHLKKSEPVIE